MGQKDMTRSSCLVEKKFFTTARPPHELQLTSGALLGPITIAYETLGQLNDQASNAIFITHALSGDSHVAGYYSENDPKADWWDSMVGPGSTNPDTGKPYGLDFPVVTIGDMVTLQKALVDELQISKLLAVIGGSVGGMQVSEWAIRYPEMMKAAIPLATTSRHSALAIAFNEIGRQAIMADPNFNRGNYYAGPKPDLGLALAFDFDANSFLYITKAADYYDIKEQHGNGSEVEAFAKIKAKLLVISFTSDWLYPTYQSRQLVKAMKKNGLEVSFCEIAANCGHDAFFLPNKRQDSMISNFLAQVACCGD